MIGTTEHLDQEKENDKFETKIIVLIINYCKPRDLKDISMYTCYTFLIFSYYCKYVRSCDALHNYIMYIGGIK